MDIKPDIVKVVWLITRDYRITDNNTLNRAFEMVKQLRTKGKNAFLYPVFKCNSEQLDKNINIYHNNFAIQFIAEALDELYEKIPITVLDVEEDLFETIRPYAIFIMRDFSPYARERYSSLYDECTRRNVLLTEVDDVTLRIPSEKDRLYQKLSYFIKGYSVMSTPSDYKITPGMIKLMVREVSFDEEKKRYKDIKKGKEKIPSKVLGKYYEYQPDMRVHPGELEFLLENFKEYTTGYSIKKNRESILNPKVSFMSCFVKFGLISIRQLYNLPIIYELDEDDTTAFQREVMFRDFYYHMAVISPEEVFITPYWEHHGSSPRFIHISDLLEYRKFKNVKSSRIDGVIKKDIEQAHTEYLEWTQGKTGIEIVDSGMKDLINTGYMLNRQRMICVSYLVRDKGIWWVYAERFFARFLTDYDRTINALNHQNISRIGLYPKYTRDFSIKLQDKKYAIELRKG